MSAGIRKAGKKIARETNDCKTGYCTAATEAQPSVSRTAKPFRTRLAVVLEQWQEPIEEGLAFGETVESAVDAKRDGTDVVAVSGKVKAALGPLLQRRLEGVSRHNQQIWIAFEILIAGFAHAAVVTSPGSLQHAVAAVTKSVARFGVAQLTGLAWITEAIDAFRKRFRISRQSRRLRSSYFC